MIIIKRINKNISGYEITEKQKRQYENRHNLNYSNELSHDIKTK